MALDTFGGGEIQAWLDKYSLNPDIEWLLLDLGVEVVEDLDTLFDTSNDLLVKAQKALPETEFKHLVNSYKHFKGDPIDTGKAVPGDSSSKIASRASKNRPDRQILRHSRRITALDHRLRELETLDLAIMLDCTGSMAPYIKAAKGEILTLVNVMRDVHAAVPLRVAFVGYRDLCDGATNLVVLPFTTSIDQFQQKLAAVRAYGGGNPLTDLTGALHRAQQFEWTSGNRVLYHVGDYPCHGSEFHHHDLWDAYPSGDPAGKHPCSALKCLQKLHVRYYFGKVTDHTDKMIARFNELMDCEFVHTTPMDSTNMMDVITLNVTTVLSSTLSTSSSTDNANPNKMKEYRIVPDMPIWSTVATERAVVYLLTPVQSIDAVAAGCLLGEKSVEDFPEPSPATFQCAQHPFTKGRSKLAYYALQLLGEDPEAPTRAVVLKDSQQANSSHRTKEKFEQLVSCQRAAAFLAPAFNQVRPMDCPAIEYATLRVLQFLARPDKPYFIEEDLIPGEWERYSNNTGYCAPIPTPAGTDHAAVQAFSHWTHHVSGGKLMVTDCQGSYNKEHNSFLLTDPAIHCTALLSYGGTNMGEKGFERFFATHRCNEICQAMGLQVRAGEKG